MATREHDASTASLASLVGSFIEWYDFYIFGIASALVFGRLFFPSASPAAGTLLSFATFATAWIARPVGGVLFGHFGDRVGRKSVLLVTLLLMGGSTTVIGLLPSYDSIGIWAPIILVMVRIIQGISAGGEWAGAAIMAVEHAPAGGKGRFGSYPQLGIPLALIAANGLSLAFYQNNDAALLSYGWRIPFLASLLIVPLGLYIRLKVLESPEFAHAQRMHRVPQVPLLAVLRDYWRPVLSVIFIMGGVNAFFFTFTTYSLTYATTQAGLTRTVALSGVIIAACVHAVATLVFGAWSDRIGRRQMFMTGLVILACTPFPLFMAMDTHSATLYIVSLTLAFGIGHAMVWSIGASYFTELFPAAVRYTGSSLGYQVSGLVFGGPLPIIGAVLVGAEGGRPWYLAALVSGIALLGAAAAYLSPDTQATRTGMSVLAADAEAS